MTDTIKGIKKVNRAINEQETLVKAIMEEAHQKAKPIRNKITDLYYKLREGEAQFLKDNGWTRLTHFCEERSPCNKSPLGICVFEFNEYCMFCEKPTSEKECALAHQQWIENHKQGKDKQ
jgi:DNA polymerase elongation subunit (family B)